MSPGIRFLLECWEVADGRQSRTLAAPLALSADIKQLSRHLSRIVHLVLYGVIAFRETIGLFNGIWHGGDDDALVVLLRGC